MDRYFSFLWVRGANAGVKTIRVRRVLAIGALVAVAALIALRGRARGHPRGPDL